MAQARLKARDNHKPNVKVKASLVETADSNRQTDEEVAREGKVNDRMVTKVSEVVVLKARQLNNLPSPLTFRISGRAVFDIVHIHFFSIFAIDSRRSRHGISCAWHFRQSLDSLHSRPHALDAGTSSARRWFSCL